MHSSHASLLVPHWNFTTHQLEAPGGSVADWLADAGPLAEARRDCCEGWAVDGNGVKPQKKVRKGLGFEDFDYVLMVNKDRLK